MSDELTNTGYETLLGDIVNVLQNARSAAARGVDTVMTTAYWLTGRRIVEEEQSGERRAEYGAAIIFRLAADLTSSQGRGFGERNLQQMRRFYLTWPTGQISQTFVCGIVST